MRRVSVHGRLHGTEAIVRLFTNRFVLQGAFAAVILIIASQTIHAREFGGFIGKRALLSSFITSEEADLTEEEVVEGPALPIVRPTFRAASISSALQPTVLAAEATFEAPPATAGLAIIQPILTDAAVEETGRAGIQMYTVEPGDTPSTIAERFGLNTSTILWENKLQAWSMIRPGDVLRVLPTDGVSHTVTRGETLEGIAKRYGADAEEILEFNRLVDADDIDIGDLLIIPGGRPPAVVAPPVIRRPARPALPLPSIAGKFLWPSEAGYRISQYFTWRHHGVDVAVAAGTNVFASEAGTVVSSGWIRGYGYQVLIDHGSGLQTRYAHNSKLLVSKGQPVTRGQVIALVGSTGRSTGPHIHFEVYANGVRVNPFRYLR
jgi:LysM repeat protein